ncbi:hypothetical protein ACIBO2_08620 [Nonomuraea sp. NPDC050022]
MNDLRMFHCFSGHTIHAMADLAVISLDGVSGVVGSDRSRTIWTWT